MNGLNFIRREHLASPVLRNLNNILTTNLLYCIAVSMTPKDTLHALTTRDKQGNFFSDIS